MKRARRLDELTVGPDNMLVREGAVPVKVTARVVRGDTGAPLRDLVHFFVSQRGLAHTWEPRSDRLGHYTFEPRLLRPGMTRFVVHRVCFSPTVIRVRVDANGHVRLGNVRLAPERALPGTIGVFLEAWDDPRLPPVTVEEILLEGPAYRAGLQQGDRLLEIEGKPVVPENAERLLRGRPGTSVTVTVRRPYALRDGTLHPVRPRSLTFTVIRAPGKATRRRHPLWRA
jgi:membrane-associated protease RseP (regulator of RpoE activity)